MHRRLVLLLICFFSLIINLFAQQKGQVVGVIKDAETNGTLIGVSIYEENCKWVQRPTKKAIMNWICL